jgi:phenylacetate-coenzyme A ligase PaaK-like adenylate-forming protein
MRGVVWNLIEGKLPMTPRRAAPQQRSPASHAVAGPLELLRGATASLRCAAHLGDIWTVRQGGAAAIATAQRQRLDALIASARADSPFYRERYRHLPPGIPALAQLPVVTKRDLMARFDDWVIDPEVTRAGVEAFIAEPARVGERYLGRYLVWKSSGTSGEPGVFVQSEDAPSIYDALFFAQLQTLPLAAGFARGQWLGGGRSALIAATGEHFASICSWQRQVRESPWANARAYSVLQPPAAWVAALNDYQPAFLASYPTVLALLAAEQTAGRLRIAPRVIWSGGERLAPATAAAIARAFGCPVANEYGASECMSIAFGCGEGALHVNADWVVLEPVDARLRPTPPGELSHTVLLTNLANPLQPLIRYDLGDRIALQPGPCRCGSPLPAIRVEGRCDDVLVLRSAAGEKVSLLPLALTTVVEEAGAVHRFQILQRTPECIALRFDAQELGCTARGRRAATAALRAFLRRHALANVAVLQDAHPLAVHPRSGKFRQVIAARY